MAYGSLCDAEVEAASSTWLLFCRLSNQEQAYDANF